MVKQLKHCSLRLKGRPDGLLSMIQNIMSDKVDVLMAPAVATHYLTYSERLKMLGFEFGYTKTIDFYEVSTVVSLARTGSLPIFAYFLCFPTQVWALILASILFLSLISSIKERFQFDFQISLNIYSITRLYCFRSLWKKQF